jgi:hypothetical protein
MNIGLQCESHRKMRNIKKRKLRESALLHQKPIPSARGSGFKDMDSAHRTAQPRKPAPLRSSASKPLCFEARSAI